MLEQDVRTWPSTGIGIKKWCWFQSDWMVDDVIQGGWAFYHKKGIRHKGNDSLPYLAFWRMLPMQFFKIFKGRQIILEPFMNSKYPIRCLLWWHKTLLAAIWTQVYSESLQIPKRECFCINSEQLKVVNWIRKNTPS